MMKHMYITSEDIILGRYRLKSSQLVFIWEEQELCQEYGVVDVQMESTNIYIWLLCMIHGFL